LAPLLPPWLPSPLRSHPRPPCPSSPIPAYSALPPFILARGDELGLSSPSSLLSLLRGCQAHSDPTLALQVFQWGRDTGFIDNAAPGDQASAVLFLLGALLPPDGRLPSVQVSVAFPLRCTCFPPPCIADGAVPARGAAALRRATAVHAPEPPPPAPALGGRFYPPPGMMVALVVSCVLLPPLRLPPYSP
jgi:hypothetical protein